MEQTQPYYDPNIINCDDIPDTISITTTPEKHKKVKKPKRKHTRKIDLNIDNLLITRKLKKKKKKFKCVLNVNSMCKERSVSIVRSTYNVCKKEAYYHRIVPVCLRKMCSGDDIPSCCRSIASRNSLQNPSFSFKDYKEYRHPKGSLPPVSSISITPLTDAFAFNNLSYEDVSNGNFSSDAEEYELDTLIKRTKQREREINHTYPAREYTSTPLSKLEYIPTPSPYSIDTDKKSLHSDTTMVLRPLSFETYSPTASLDDIKQEYETNDDIFDINAYSPTITPDLIKMRMDLDDVPYSPTFTPEIIEIDYPTMNINDTNAPYSVLTPGFIKAEDLDKNYLGNEPYSPTISPHIMENNCPEDRVNLNDVNVKYSPRSPTVSTDFHKFTIPRQIHENYQNGTQSAMSAIIKQENVNDRSTITSSSIAPNSTTMTRALIKRENHSETNYNINNTIHCKIEKNDSQRNTSSHVYTNEIVVKTEKEGHLIVNSGRSMVFQNVFVKTEKE